MMKLRPQKRRRSSEDDSDRDRLSEMPDEIIVRILSCMTTIDAVRTLLLRRFGNLWTLVHNLNFDICHVGFIRNVLMLHQKPSVDRFHLSVDFDSDDERDEAADDVRIFFRFAFGKQAKEIRLCDHSCYKPLCTTILPKFASEFLVTLVLDYCRFEGEAQVNLISLKKLSLEYVSMSDENFQRFISGCPSLQELIIVNPYTITKISFSSPNIQKLSLLLTEEHWDRPLLINVPNLRSLYLEIDIYQLDIANISSLSDIYIKYPGFAFVPVNDEYLNEINKMLLGKFHSTEVFRLSNGASKISLHAIQNLQLLQNRWKRIVLELDEICEICLLGICHLLRISKHLEELVICTTNVSNTFESPIRLPCK